MTTKGRLCLTGTLILLVAFSGCSGGSSTTLPVSVSLSPTSTTLQIGTTTNFSATVGNDSANRGVTWVVSCSVQPCGSVSPKATASGAVVTYSAPNTPPVSDLKVTLTATAVADTSKSASATITVEAITVSVAPTTAAVQVGGTTQFSASVSFDPANAGVNWTVSCSAAQCGTVSPTSTASGDSVTYTAPGTAPASNLAVTVTATSVTDATKSSSAILTVPSVVVSVAPASATVVAGSTTQLAAAVTHDTANKGVTWTVSCSLSPCGNVSPTTTASGAATTYTAPGPPASDLTVTVTATSVANPLAMASAIVTVLAITVGIEPQSATVLAGTTQQFTATVGNDPSNKGVTWTVSCSPSPCGSVSPTSTASGVAITYTAPGLPSTDLTVAVTATSVSDSTKSSQATVTIPAVVVSAVSPNSAIIPVNATQQFTATISNDATNAGVTWTLTQNGTDCSPGCGQTSPTSAASGALTTYTAPATVPSSATVILNASAVADTTKSSNATITLTSGTVKLVPASLAFRCKIRPTNTCPPPAQTITLTDTATAALTINGITITGPNAAQFLLTNNCPASVNAGSFCTVSVTFHPSVVGSYTASVSFDDGSSDSPQQVTLSGNATSVQVRNAAEALSELAGTSAAFVPAPTGPELVGTRVMHLTDPTRQDPYLLNGTRRELAVRLWYPAFLQPNQNCKSAEYTSPAVWNYFAQLVGVRPFQVRTNSCWDAPLADGAHPVVIFTPGFTAGFTDYTFLTEDLASRGYIVVSVAHTYETTAVQLTDGRIAKSVVGSHLGGPMQGDDGSLATAVYARLLDLEFVVRQLERFNVRHDSPISGKLDLSKIAVAGHSLGGLTAFLGIGVEPRFKAAILLDAIVPEALPSGTKKPALILAADREHWESTECHLWSNLEGPRLAVNLRGTEHVALGDWIWLARDSVKTGPMGPEKTMAAIRDYIGSFLDNNLRAGSLDRTRERLLMGPSADYPDAAVTTQEQPLCSKP
jgi:dienelactone hydrolase